MKQESLIQKYDSNRTEEFQKNKNLDDLICKLKDILLPGQKKVNEQFEKPQFPIVVIVGCSRSGSTLLTQLLAATGNFSYPTNFLSRFAYAPYVGAMIQQMLFDKDYDYRNELSDIKSSLEFSSKLGKTNGALGVSEFFHFWRKFFPNYDPGYLNDHELLKVDISWMRREIASIEAVLKKPFMSKAKMLQYNIQFFAEQVPELFFVHIKRDPIYVMQSTLQSRRKYYGRDDIWWSGKPKEYDWLSSMDVYNQIAGQVFFTEKIIDEQLLKVDKNRILICNYENICIDPNKFYSVLKKKLNKIGCSISEYIIKQKFYSKNVFKINKNEIDLLRRAYDKLLNKK